MNQTYNILDFETTGLSPSLERVIEVGAVKVEGGIVKAHFESLINPGRIIPYQITQITGITTAMVRTAPLAKDVFPSLLSFLGDDPIIAHNASFDSRFFLAEAARVGGSPKNSFLCTLMLARRLYPSLSSHSLENLCRHLSIERMNANRALSDVLMTHKLFVHICAEVKIKSSSEALNLDKLLALSQTPKAKVSEFLKKVT